MKRSVFSHSALGFDEIFDWVETVRRSTETTVKYPKYNIIQPSNNEYIIEMAVAGFSKSDLDVTYDEKLLTITGKGSNDPDDDKNYTVRNLAKRSFETKFEVRSAPSSVEADLTNGILTVNVKFAEPVANTVKIK